ncbi:hypothetical protein XELAEV_18026768mg [Xenopus laevis]|uniref:Uncharacterized protein n=1 Tax=Xenopus laevis TaxID=8355 RepID=A0A974HJ17_XENLA|nr:hypothetical protein XELAEV_18026768mg [Xenopus laevis]
MHSSMTLQTFEGAQVLLPRAALIMQVKVGLPRAHCFWGPTAPKNRRVGRDAGREMEGGDAHREEDGRRGHREGGRWREGTHTGRKTEGGDTGREEDGGRGRTQGGGRKEGTQGGRKMEGGNTGRRDRLQKCSWLWGAHQGLNTALLLPQDPLKLL